MDTVKLKPAPGKLVRDPDTFRALSTGGEDKPLNQYWQRRIQAGDVVVVQEGDADAVC